MLTFRVDLCYSVVIFFLFASAAIASAQTSPACTHYASPTGTGNGLSQSSPFKIQNFWAVAGPGKTLCLLDGTYQGAANMISPGTVAPGKSGTSGAPITIRAINDGGVVLDGEFVRTPVFLNANSRWVLEGFNAKHSNSSVAILRASHDNVYRRLIFWDANMSTNNDIITIDDSERGLYEDIALFGAGRKCVAPFETTNGSIFRRLWCRWEGSITQGPKQGVEWMYGSPPTSDLLFENILTNWSGESLPQEYDLTDTNGVPFSPPVHFTNFNIEQFATMMSGAAADLCQGVRTLGSLAYLKPTDRFPFPDTGMIAGEATCHDFRHVLAVISPSHSNFTSQYGFGWGTAQSQTSAHNISTIRGAGDVFAGSTDVQNFVAAISLAGLDAAGANPWSGTTGAKLCKRWVNGQVTNEPLWPWPMNQRIKAATASAGTYVGPCPTCVGGRATRKATDVTAELEFLLGPIPQACRTSSSISPGDLDADGQVNASDLQLMVNVILGTETSSTIRSRADLNGDGAVNALDLQRLVNIVLGV